MFPGRSHTEQNGVCWSDPVQEPVIAQCGDRMGRKKCFILFSMKGKCPGCHVAVGPGRGNRWRQLRVEAGWGKNESLARTSSRLEMQLLLKHKTLSPWPEDSQTIGRPLHLSQILSLLPDGRKVEV